MRDSITVVLLQGLLAGSHDGNPEDAGIAGLPLVSGAAAHDPLQVLVCAAVQVIMLCTPSGLRLGAVLCHMHPGLA